MSMNMDYSKYEVLNYFFEVMETNMESSNLSGNDICFI